MEEVGEEEEENKTIDEKEFIENFEKKEKKPIKKKTKLYKRNTMDAYSRHIQFMDSYIRFYGGDVELKKIIKEREENFKKNYKSDFDLIKKEYKFIFNEQDDFESTWEKRTAKKYYERLFKEYCLADLSKYKEKKIGLRWRLESEVIKGKGQFICGNIKCQKEERISTFEVNFEYFEDDEEKQALVKLRLCKSCGKKLQKIHGEENKKKRKRDETDDEDEDKKKEIDFIDELCL